MLPGKRDINDTQTILSNSAPVSALTQEREGHYTFAKHIHKTFEIYLITEGCCSMGINNDTIQCGQGDYILILPNTIHSFEVNNEKPCRFCHVHFDGARLKGLCLEGPEGEKIDIVHSVILCCNFFFKAQADKRITRLIHAILDDACEVTPYTATYVNLHIMELLLYTAELAHAQFLYDKGGFLNQNHYIVYTMKYIEENYASKILISDIAEELNITSRYLSKLFFKHMNLTILNYINIYRINQAIELMMCTDLPLTTIAAQTGLKDSQHFSKLFRSTIGTTPYNYRKLLKHELSPTTIL